MISDASRWTRRSFLKSAAATLGLAGAASLLAACQQTATPATKPAESKPTDATKPADAAKPATAASTVPAAPAAATAAVPTTAPAAAAKPTEAAKPAAQGAPASSAGTPKAGGSTVWTAEVDPVSLDPHKTSNFSSAQAWGDLTYQSLVMFDEQLKVVPALAESWSNPSPTTWTFKLRQGVKFHDGSELDAEDVKFWYDRMMAPATAAPYKSWYNQITKVEPKGTYDVEFTLSDPYAPFLVTFAAMRGSAIVPRAWGANADMTKQAIGTGPFKIVDFVPQSHIEYVKNPDYWEKGLPYLDRVTFKIASDEETRVAGLRSGQVKYAFISPEAAQRLKSDPNVVIMSSEGPSQRVTNLNTKRKPFDDVRVRQAIALTLDRTAALDKSVNGEGKLTGPLPTGHGNWFIPPDQLGYTRDIAMAKQLLADAGYPNGFESTIKTTPDYPTMLSTSIIMADQLKEIGIKLNVQQMEWGTLVKDINSRDYDIHSNGNSFFPDPDSYMYLKYHSKGAQNFSSWENSQYDGLIDKARTIMDPAERKKIYDEAQKILLNEAPLVWWFTENNIEALHKSQKGYSQSFTGRRMFLKKVWIEE